MLLLYGACRNVTSENWFNNSRTCHIPFAWNQITPFCSTIILCWQQRLIFVISNDAWVTLWTLPHELIWVSERKILSHPYSRSQTELGGLLWAKKSIWSISRPPSVFFKWEQPPSVEVIGWHTHGHTHRRLACPFIGNRVYRGRIKKQQFAVFASECALCLQMRFCLWAALCRLY